VLQTIWLSLTWTDKAVIAANLVLVVIYFVSRQRKQRALARAKDLRAKNLGEGRGD
jgi:hypothetical protein